MMADKSANSATFKLRGSQPKVDCKLCDSIAKFLYTHMKNIVNDAHGLSTEDPSSSEVELGQRSNLETSAKACATCSSIFQTFHLFPDQREDLGVEKYEYSMTAVLNMSYCNLSLVSPFAADQVSVRNFSLFPSKEQSFKGIPESKVSLQVMDPQWIDLERLIEWMRNCDETHPSSCRETITPKEALDSLGILLIDVKRMCLVQADGCEDYVALSYVWGPAKEQFATTKATYNALREPGGLESQTVGQSLPGTVRRAIELTKLIGHQFLWVDRFCIVQDDPVYSARQINGMATIYSHAFVTFCAADGPDSDSGLLGIPGTSEERKLSQTVFDLSGDLGVFTFVVPQAKSHSVYDERGWTFQEKQLTRRNVRFGDGGLVCQCQQGAFVENKPSLLQRDFYQTLNFRSSDKQWPNLRRWYLMLDAYLNRKLTYPGDILSAFAGVEEAFRASIGSSHYGLPESFFDLGILWIPNGPLTRREQISQNSHTNTFPSWSWAGWHGKRSSNMSYLGLGHIRGYQQFPGHITFSAHTKDVSPRLRWFKQSLTGYMSPIANDWARYQEKHESLDSLPQGWSRHQAKDLTYYEYDKAPVDCTFWYPLSTIRDVISEKTDDYSPILTFKTSRSWLDIGEELPREDISTTSNTALLYSVYTPDEQWAGILYLHQRPIETEAGSAKLEQRCELIVISSGFAIDDEYGVRWTKADGAIFKNDDAEEIRTESSDQDTISSTSSPSNAKDNEMHEEGDESVNEISEETASESFDSDSDEGVSIETNSEAWNSEAFPEWRRLQTEGILGDRYDFYNVLWIEWHKGLAYRKGIGRVEMKLWDMLDLEEVEINLA